MIGLLFWGQMIGLLKSYKLHPILFGYVLDKYALRWMAQNSNFR